MAAVPKKHSSSSADVRRLTEAESARAVRFFQDAGYPVPLGNDFVAWGAFENGDELVGCLALCTERGEFILRGPEILDSKRRRGIGRVLLRFAVGELAWHTSYCVAYGYLYRMYRDAGFRKAAGDQDGPEFLRKRVRDLNAKGWEVRLLVRKPGVIRNLGDTTVVR